MLDPSVGSDSNRTERKSSEVSKVQRTYARETKEADNTQKEDRSSKENC